MLTASGQPHQRHRSTPSPATPPHGEAPQAVRGVPAVADPKLASVSAIEQPHHHVRAVRAPARPLSREALLRKEVIQPHLPVRLPCYDFVPIASPTFDGSPHKG